MDCVAPTGTLRAERIEPAFDFGSAPKRLSIEGFVQQRTPAGFRVDRIDADVSKLGAGAAVATPDARVVVSGPVGADGRLDAERIDVIAPERPAANDRPARGASGNSGSEKLSNAPAATGERAEKRETIETPDPAEVLEQPEPIEKPETVEPHEAPETPEQVERPETPEVEHVETPERVERPEAREPPELPEVPESH